MGSKCPVCDDPAPYIWWCDPRPPQAPCPYGAHNVLDCSYQQRMIRVQKLKLRFCPDLLDANGNFTDSTFIAGFARILEAGFNPMTGHEIAVEPAA